MTLTLAHAGHWYHALLYVAPVVLIALGLWWSGRRTGADEPSAPDEDADR